MPRDPGYAPVPMPPDEIDPSLDGALVDPEAIRGLKKKTRKQLQQVRDKAIVDAAQQHGMRLKHRLASQIEDDMTTTAGDNLSSTIDHLEDIREQPGRGTWAKKRMEGATDRLAGDTERRQRAIAEGVGRQVSDIARKRIDPDEEDPSLLERLLRGE
jgi:hypothetical protein